MTQTTEKMPAWVYPHHVDNVLKIQEYGEELGNLVANADDDEIYPARVKDFVRDIQGFCQNLLSHLDDSQKKLQKELSLTDEL